MALLLASSAVTLAGCETRDSGPLDTLRAMPESHLAPFPGATLLRENSMPRRSGFLEATTGAYLLREFGTHADFHEVAEYYDGLLKPLGWSGCYAWQKDGYIFSIEQESAVADPSDYRTYGLVYSEILAEDTSATSVGATPALKPCGPVQTLPPISPDASAS